MKHGFGGFQRTEAASAGSQYGTATVEGGQTASVPAILKDPLYVVRPKSATATVEMRPRLKTVEAPVTAGSEVGVVEAYCDGRLASQGTLVAAGPVAKSAAVAKKSGGRTWYFGFAALVGVIGIGYGSSFAKAARIRRHRIKAIMRGANLRR
jgi:D-alanyl-D-alanine carboxypeptidase